jgi:hypothetical protein
MATPAVVPGCTITINVFDGTRKPISAGTNVLYTIRNGNQQEVFRDFRTSASLSVVNLPFFNNFGDLYSVIAWAQGHKQAGFTPVKVAPNLPQQVDLMLLADDAGFNFAHTWDSIQARRPALARLLAAQVSSPAAARDRFTELYENRSPVAACLLNLATAMDQINLPVGTPLDYFQQIVWDDSMAQDRFFAYADARLLDQVRLAAQQHIFAPDPGAAVFHPGATSSYKQIQFGEANVQLTFHENDRRQINGLDCVKMEPDMDYYRDLAAHAILEVITNALTHTLTDPRQVYVLRWIAGRRAGVAEFDPLYTIS